MPSITGRTFTSRISAITVPVSIPAPCTSSARRGDRRARPSRRVVNGIDGGLAIAGKHYFAVVHTGSQENVGAGVYEFDPVTLALGKQIASSQQLGGGDPRGLAIDPTTGDLFVTTYGSGIYRIHDPAGTPMLTEFNSVSADGIAFSPSGSELFVAPYNGGGLPDQVDGFKSSGASVPGFPVVVSGNPSGVVVAPPNDVVDGVNVSNNVFVNGTAGTVYRINTNDGDAVSTVATGGSGGN